MIRQLFRPRYGTHFEVTPKHWWNPRERRTARLSAQIADYHAEEIKRATRERMGQHLIFGEPLLREPPDQK